MTFLPVTSPAEILGPILCAIMVGAGLPGLFTRDLRWRRAGVALALAALLVPWNGRVSGLVMLLGGTNGLSAATLLMLGGLSWRLLTGAVPGRFQSPALAGVVVLLSLILYPATTMLPNADPYQWGYSGWILPVLLAAVLVANALTLRDPLVFAWLALGCAGFALGLYETANLWDMLIDPAAAIGALLILGARLLRGTIPGGSSASRDRRPCPARWSPEGRARRG